MRRVASIASTGAADSRLSLQPWHHRRAVTVRWRNRVAPHAGYCGLLAEYVVVVRPDGFVGGESVGHERMRNGAPNTRMQRTRSSPSALRSPLMRCPLDARN